MAVGTEAPSTGPITSPITSFSGEYRWLSNFACVEGIIATFQGDWRAALRPIKFCPSVEHAYQASKCARFEDFAAVAGARTPGDAKRFGRRVQLVDCWERIKLDIMLDLLRQKFAHRWFGEKLAETRPRELIEGNTWGDTFWGVYKGSGQNHLGRLLMQVREELL